MGPPFSYRREPFRMLYRVIVFGVVLCFKLPYWVITNIPRSRRARPGWSLGRSVIIRFSKVVCESMFAVGFGSMLPDVANLDKDADATGFVWFQPEHLVKGEIAELAQRNNVGMAKRVGGFWYGKRTNDGRVGQAAACEERILYHLHGGAFVLETGAPCGHSALIVRELISPSGPFPRAFCLEYRLASSNPYEAKNPFPAALFDAIAGYEYLVKGLGFTPDNITVSGDSAGGNLAVALVRYISATGDLPWGMPGAMLLLSPSVDWNIHLEGPQSSFEKNRYSDYCQPFFTSGYTMVSLLGSLTLSNPAVCAYICPVPFQQLPRFHMFKGFPRTMIVAGEAEVGVDSVRRLRDGMLEDIGGKVEYLEIKDATHDIGVLEFWEPERSEAFRLIRIWLKHA